jgi:oxygen-independent coproporphyrinogen III oxidase
MRTHRRDPPTLSSAVLSEVTARHLYVHVPFCARRCVYCDFSIAVRSSVPVREYVDAVDRELGLRRETLGPLATIYLGGGTPSKLGGDGLRVLLDMIRSHASIADSAEITVETNPEDVTIDAMRAWRDAGVNRLSLGVQSFHDDVLAWMHRTHDAAAARRAIDVAREAGFTNISIDLIFAVPASLTRSWERDLDEAIAMDLPHVSVYGLTIEPKTPLGRWVARSEVEESPDESFETEFMLAHERLTAAGLQHYEVSNYGRHSAHSAHNWAYWRRRPYAGVGPAAHAFDGRERYWNADAYTRWRSILSSETLPIEGREHLSGEDVIAEQTYLGLRTTDGVALQGCEPDYVRSWMNAGWCTLDDTGRARLTAAGWLRLDAIASSLTAFRSRS